MAISRTDEGAGPGISASKASAAFEIASWTLLASFVVGAVAAGVIVFSGIERERQWIAQRDQARTRIVELEFKNAKTNADLNKAEADAAKAAQSAETLRQQAAALESAAADARKSAAAANDGAVAEAKPDAEKHKAPRTLSPQHLARIAERLGRFERTPFDLSLTPDAEAIALMGDVAKALTDSGWDWKGLPVLLVAKPTGQPHLAANRSSGLQIQVSERRKQEWEKPALELRDALNAAGIEATAEAIKADAVNDTAIHIRISSAR